MSSRRVLGAIERLDATSRDALLMVTAGLSYEETAAICQSLLRTVQSRVRRARQRLADGSTSEPLEYLSTPGWRRGAPHPALEAGVRRDSLLAA